MHDRTFSQNLRGHKRGHERWAAASSIHSTDAPYNTSTNVKEYRQ